MLLHRFPDIFSFDGEHIQAESPLYMTFVIFHNSNKKIEVAFHVNHYFCYRSDINGNYVMKNA